MKSLHDQEMPRLALWQQNFLRLHSLIICGVNSDFIWVTNLYGQEWRLFPGDTLTTWNAIIKTPPNLRIKS